MGNDVRDGLTPTAGVFTPAGMAEQRITGSFFDLQHPNLWDAAYWTDQCRFWSENSWRALVRDMHDIGIDTIISTGSALWGRPYFPGYEKTVGLPLKMGCPDPLTACVDEADRLGMRVYLGVGMRGRVSQVRDYAGLDPPWPEEWFRWNTALAEALVDRYGSRPSFAGLYISYEISFRDYQVELYEKLMKEWLRPAIGDVTILASPGSLGEVENPSELPRSLERLGIDILACQDYGGRSNDVSEALETVKRNHQGLVAARPVLDNAGVQLWTNCEVFSREWGPDGRPICTPGPIERIREQIRLQAPEVEKVICYQYQGIMNRHTDLVNIGPPESQKLYDDYVSYLRQIGYPATLP